MEETLVANRRRENRLETSIPLSWRHQGETREARRGVTRDVSPSGAYFVIESGGLEIGDLLELDLSILPGEGHSAFPGKVRGRSRVVRVEPDPLSRRHGVAVEFSEPLELQF